MIWRTLLSQWTSLVISLIIAIVVWAVATHEENPSREAFFQNPLPVEFVNRSELLVLYQKSADTVRVRLRAPDASWQQLKGDDFRATIDLKGFGAGLQQVGVNVQTADPQVSVVAVDPPQITVRLEALKQITTEVRVRVLDDAPIGYETKAPQVNPGKVLVSGPQVLIDQINDASADIALRGSKTPIDRDVSVSVHDAQGNSIQGLTLAPSTVSVHLPIEQRVGYKDVAVKAVVNGNVASGYWVSDIRVDPSTVTLVGAAEALNKIPGFVEAQPIVVTGGRDDIFRRVGLNLPPGVSALSVGDVAVRVTVQPVLGGITIRRSVLVIKVRCDQPVLISPDAVEVILSGPLPILQSLTPEDIQIGVDVNGCTGGSFQATPHVINLPDSLKVQNIVPNTVEINVRQQ